jgi:hypothetical protein
VKVRAVDSSTLRGRNEPHPSYWYGLVLILFR